MKAIILEYDPSKYRFQELVCQVLGISSLEKAHASDQAKRLNRSRTQNQQANSFDEIFKNYCSFVSKIIVNKIGNSTSTQSPPSFHLHYYERGSSVFHKDKAMVLKKEG